MIIYDDLDNVIDIIHDNDPPHPLDEQKLDEALKTIDNQKGNDYFISMPIEPWENQQWGQLMDNFKEPG